MSFCCNYFVNSKQKPFQNFYGQLMEKRPSITMEDLLLFNRNKLFRGDHIRLLVSSTLMHNFS